MIGDDVSVTVLEISGGVVLLGFEAPPSTPVHRLEVYKRVQLGLEPRRRGAVPVVEPDEFDGGSIS